MAITSLDQAIAGFQPPIEIYKIGTATVVGRFYSPFYVNGWPGAAVAPSPGVIGAALTSYSGQISFSNPVSGNTYLARFCGNVSAAGSLFLCDRLWHNSGIIVTSTGSQSINSVAFPPRDMSGMTSGAAVMIGVEVTSNMGAGTPTWKMVYTNSSGIAGQSVTTAAQTASMVAGSFIPIPLSSGDTGVQHISAWTQSATMTSGSYSLVAYRVLARLDCLTGNIGNSIDMISAGFPRLYNNTVPFLLRLPSATSAPTISAEVIYAQG